MPSTIPLVRLFVSSTFVDFEAERNALHKRVFPRLRATCAANGLRFQPIDLRWGISEAAAAEQLALPVCLKEIARCQQTRRRPNFLALIGDRYGSRLLPTTIPDREFEQVLAAIDDPDLAALVRNWYRRDSNARPAEFRLRPRSGAAGDAGQWRATEASLSHAFREAARRSGFEASVRLKYEASATEQEVARGVLGPNGDAAASFCVVRRYVDAPLGPSRSASHDGSDEDAELLRKMIEQLEVTCGNRFLRYEVAAGDTAANADYLDRFCDELGTALERAILEDRAGGGDGDKARRERAAHSAFASERSHGFVGRTQEIARTLDLLQVGLAHPILVVGPSGSGKSAFMACLEQQLRGQPGVRVVARYAGASPLCSAWPGLVESLLAELQPSGDLHGRSGASESPAATLARLLRAWSSPERLIILIDAVDQLTVDGSRTGPGTGAGGNGIDANLAWLPWPLPARVQVVLSVTDSHSAALEARTPEAGRVPLGRLSRSDSVALLKAWLAEMGRSIRPRQRDAVLKGCNSGLPLYLRLAADACASWSSYDKPPVLAPDLAGFIRQRLDGLVAPHMHGETLVARTLGYLACSRYGLPEDELLDLLSSDPAVHSEVTRTAQHALPDDRLPVVLWARLYQDMVATLTDRIVDGEPVLAFYHLQFDAAVRARFVGDALGRELHSRLAAFFGQSASPRALAERPFQQVWSGRMAAFRETMSDVEYLTARLRAHGTTNLIHDFGLGSLTGEPLGEDGGDLDHLRRVLELSAHAVEVDPAQLPTHLLARLPTAATELIGRLRQQPRFGKGPAWVEPLRVSVASVDSPLVRTMTGSSGSLTAIAGDSSGSGLVSADDEGVLEVWTVASGLVRRTLGKPGPGVRWMQTGPALRATAAGYRDDRARLWDVEAGVIVDEVTPATGQPLAVSADGSLIAIAPADGGLVFWDLVSARVVGRVKTRRLVATAGCFARDSRTCVVADRRGRVLTIPVDQPGRVTVVWSAEAEVRALYPGPDDDSVVVVTAQPAGRRFTSATDLAILVLDVNSRRIRWRVPAVFEALWCSLDGTTAVGRELAGLSNSPDAPQPWEELMAFDLQAHERRWVRNDGSTVTDILTWSPTGEHALTLELEFEKFHYSSQVWHRIGWMETASGRRSGDFVLRMEANKGLHVLAGSARSQGTSCVVEDTVYFPALSGPSPQPIVTPGVRVVGVVPLDGGRRIATASGDGNIRIWKPTTDGPKDMLRAPIRAVARSTATEIVVVRAAAVERIDVSTWDRQSSRDAGPAMLSSEIALAAASASGAWIAYLDANTFGISHQEMYMWPTEELVLWDVRKACRAAVLTTRFAGGPQIDCTLLAVNNDGNRVALGVRRPDAQAAAVSVWLPRKEAELVDIEVRPAQLNALALTADGLTLATAWLDGEVVISDIRELTAPVRRRFSSGPPVRALAWSPDARFLAWACRDGTISIASAANLDERIGPFIGEGDSLIYAPDGSYVLAVGTSLAWHRAADGAIVASLTLDTPFVDAAVLDASHVVAGDHMGALHLLALRNTELAG